jgi:acetate---CoA ligase (ADP-forming)
MTSTLVPAIDLHSLLSPSAIAIIGASPSRAGHAGRTLHNLIETGYEGAVYPVTPTHEQISGLACVPRIQDIEEPIDLAYIVVRADRVESAVSDCVEKGVKTIVVCSAGYAELSDEGRDLQDRLRDMARAGGARILGPNCIGVVDVVDNVVGCPTLNILTSTTPGGIALVSQSGGMGINVFNRAQGRGIGMRALISVGNECDVDASELVAALARDPHTRVIALVVEQIRDGGAFLRAVDDARAAGIPVVALKLGSSEAGKRSTMGHTGALAGEHRVFSAVCAGAGIVEVTGIDELADVAYLLDKTAGINPAASDENPGLAIVSASGGECTYVADRASARGISVPPLSPDTELRLATTMKLSKPGNPLDPSGQVIGDAELLRTVLSEILNDDAFAAAIFAVATWGEFDAERLLPVFVDAAKRSDKVVVISEWTARGLTERAEEILRESGVLTFPSSDQAVAALAGWFKYHAVGDCRVALSDNSVHPVEIPVGGIANEYEIKQFLTAQGLASAEERLIRGSDDDAIRSAAEIAESLGWPVVVKGVAAGVVHKSELGLVRVGAASSTAVAEHLREIAESAAMHDVALDGFLVSEHVGGVEMIVGGTRDDTFGPVVTVGAGGVLTEYFDDVAFGLCPMTARDAEKLLDGLKVTRILGGARGKHYDVADLVSRIVALSRIMAGASWIDELELNPIIVRELPRGGALAVDAVLIPHPSPHTTPPRIDYTER